jgi:hypothetical protein
MRSLFLSPDGIYVTDTVVVACGALDNLFGLFTPVVALD